MPKACPYAMVKSQRLKHFFGGLLCEYQHFFGRLLCECLHFFGGLFYLGFLGGRNVLFLWWRGSALTDPTDLTVLPLWVGNLTEVVCGEVVCGVLSDDSECSECSDY